WQALSPRTRECLLATAVEAAVTARAGALRPCYDPHRLAAVVAAAARRMLAAVDPVPVRAGPVWVIPQLRGLPDWPGIRVADRLGALRRHPLAMESGHNRAVASTALLGGEGGTRLDADLAIAGVGISAPLRLGHAARIMGAGGHGRQPGWLEAVLSWPQRFIRPDPSTPGRADPDVGGTATR